MKLYFHKFGSGEPLVILHGLFGISDNWVTVGKRLAEKFTVYIPDLRNHGRSPHSQVFNYHAMVDDLLEFFDDHSIDKAIIIGHSMGGKVGMNFALEYPSAVEKLVVVDISPKAYPYRQQHVKVIEAMMVVNFDTFTTRASVEKRIREFINDNKVVQFMMKNLYRLERGRLGWRLNVETISNNLDAIFGGVDEEAVLYKKTLFIKGGLSDYITNEDKTVIGKIFPHSEIRVIDGASHWVHSDKPAELCLMLSQFLGQKCELEN
jgi:esterase